MRAWAGVALALLLGAAVASMPRAHAPDATRVAPAVPGTAAARRIVYECGPEGRADICSVPAAGGPERRLVTHTADDLWPRVTPDGTAVVFSSAEDGGRFQLWEVDLAGGAPRRLRRSAAREWQADPAPDGRRLVLISDDGGRESLRVVRRGASAADAGREVFTHGPRVVLGNPHWSPDGRQIVFSSNAGPGGHHVYTVAVEGGPARRLSPLLSGACEPRFHPSGRKLAYVRRQHLSRQRSRIVEHDLDSGRERVLVDWPALNYDPVYSPEGDELAFTSDIAGSFAVYRQRLADGRAWRLTFGEPARHPDYAPRR